MELQMKRNLSWVKKFNKDSKWKEYRFKMIKLAIPKLHFPEEIVDIVDKNLLFVKEEKRLPLLLGTGISGIYPFLTYELFDALENSYMAVLGKASFSSIISGLSIYKIENRKLRPIIRFNCDGPK